MSFQILIHAIPALKDNYIWAIVDHANHHAIIIDPGEALPVYQFLSDKQLILSAIFLTHHHWDHTNGAPEIAAKYNVPIYAPAKDNISFTTKLVQVHEPDIITISHFPTFKVLDIPAHTLGHIAYYAPGILFCGDTLFSAGCGRLFEGTAEQMYLSLQKLAALPPDTGVYCGHEYTLNNLRFAKTIEPENTKIDQAIERAAKLKNRSLPTLPSTIGEELEFNPFLRCKLLTVINQVNHLSSQHFKKPIDVFAELRKLKDNFK